MRLRNEQRSGFSFRGARCIGKGVLIVQLRLDLLNIIPYFNYNLDKILISIQFNCREGLFEREWFMNYTYII